MTVPMLLPQTFARCLHTATIIGYSIFLGWYWAPPAVAMAVIYGLAYTLMTSLLTDHSVNGDRWFEPFLSRSSAADSHIALKPFQYSKIPGM